eukprot:Blabericola_migrator_1__10238@NODE_572_length_7517_cov_232_454094_g426_i0_p4_GENE_NODE_572_length_7517_cov_232_454094_g426_i0NODE_572_length_7517_cov_232_454094_g426_i0_p4_ORF_typecomplete_len245_score66_59Med21/PF11221_8/0_00076_NODE_572_length_7517_cov_232_454094_g426_i037324466
MSDGQTATPTDIVIENGLQRTVITSAPALDAITQTQIALNNLLDQVRETFLFLLEGAPPLDTETKFVNQPEDTLKRWKKFRVEFEEEWRSGKTRRKKATTNDTETLNLSTDTAEAADDDIAEILPTSIAPPPITEQAMDAVQSDVLFRAQRIAAITQSIRGLTPQLPSTKIEQDGKLIDIGDPHKSAAISAKIEHWKKLNASIEESAELHSEALHGWMKSINKATRVVSKEIMKAPQQRSTRWC